MDVNHELGSIRHIVDSPLSSKVAMFNKVANQHKTSQLLNPFASVDGRCSPKPSFSKDEYGKPLAGSLTEQRGHKANLHIFKEILELCEVIESEGFEHEDNPDHKIIFFGELFNIYNHISDKCVGLLLRARKHKLIHFEGEMLFQRRDDEVPIFMLKPFKEIRTILEEKQNEIKRAASPAPQPTTLIGSNRASPVPDKKPLSEKNSAASLEFKPILEKSDLSVVITNEPVPPTPITKPIDKTKDNQRSQMNRNKMSDDITSSASIQIFVGEDEKSSDDNKSLDSAKEVLIKAYQILDSATLSSSESEAYINYAISEDIVSKNKSETASKSTLSDIESLNTSSINSGSILELGSSESDLQMKTTMIFEPKVKSVKPSNSKCTDVKSTTSSQTNVPCLNGNISDTNTTIKSDESNQSLDNLLNKSQTIEEVKESQINLIDSSYNLQNGFGSEISMGETASEEVLISDVVVHFEPQNTSLSDLKLNILYENESMTQSKSVETEENNSLSESKLNTILESKTSEISVQNSTTSKETVIAKSTGENNSLPESKLNLTHELNTTLESKSSESLIGNDQNTVENIFQKEPNSISDALQNATDISLDKDTKLKETKSQISQSHLLNNSKSEMSSEFKAVKSNTDLEINTTEFSLSLDNKTHFMESELKTSLELKGTSSANIDSELSDNLYSLEKEGQHSIPVKVSP